MARRASGAPSRARGCSPFGRSTAATPTPPPAHSPSPSRSGDRERGTTTPPGPRAGRGSSGFIWGRRGVPASPAPAQLGSVDERQQPPGAPTVVGVPLAELRLEQGFLGIHPRDERRDQQERDQEADRAAEDQGPTEQAHQQAEVAGMADHPI